MLQTVKSAALGTIAPTLKKLEPGQLPPPLGAGDAEYDALVGRRSEILAAIAADKTKVRVELAKLAAGKADTETRKQRAERIIGGDDPDNVQIASSRSELDRLSRRIEAHAAAIPEIDAKIYEARARASLIICAIGRDEYLRIENKLCETLLAAHRAHLDLIRFTDRLNENNVNWTAEFEPHFPLFLRSPMGDGGWIGTFLREAVRLGFFPKNRLPEELR